MFYSGFGFSLPKTLPANISCRIEPKAFRGILSVPVIDKDLVPGQYGLHTSDLDGHLIDIEIHFCIGKIPVIVQTAIAQQDRDASLLIRPDKIIIMEDRMMYRLLFILRDQYHRTDLDQVPRLQRLCGIDPSPSLSILSNIKSGNMKHRENFMIKIRIQMFPGEKLPKSPGIGDFPYLVFGHCSYLLKKLPMESDSPHRCRYASIQVSCLRGPTSFNCSRRMKYFP